MEGKIVMFRTLGRVGAGLAIGLFALAPPASADTITFDFTSALQGGAFGAGSSGNTRTYSSGGITVTVTGWGYTFGTTDSALQAAALGKWSPGLGVCNNTEDCEDPQHQVDNVGADDWVLFLFSAPVDVTSVRIDPSGVYDRDASYFLGNTANPLNLNGVTYAGLAGLGFGGVQNDSSFADSAFRDVAINGGFVNAMLFGGFLNGEDQDDRFKIKSLTATTAVPEPASIMLMLGGAGILGRMRRRRR